MSRDTAVGELVPSSDCEDHAGAESPPKQASTDDAGSDEIPRSQTWGAFLKSMRMGARSSTTLASAGSDSSSQSGRSWGSVRGGSFSARRAAQRISSISYFGLAPGGDDAAGKWRQTLQELQGDSDDLSTGTSSSSSSAEDSPEKRRGGIRDRCPDFYQWLMARTTSRQKLVTISLFLCVDAARFALFDHALRAELNTLSVFVSADALSLVAALVTSMVMEGSWGLSKIFEWHGLWRFLSISILFVCAAGLNVAAFRTGLPPAIISMIGKSYLPMTAAASIFAFRRKYGKLEWLSMAMLMLSIAAFILLRDKCHLNDCQELTLSKGNNNVGGVFFVLLSVVTGAIASIMAERIFKDRSLRLLKHNRWRNPRRYYIFRAQMDLWTTLLWTSLWVVNTMFFTFPLDHLRGSLDGEAHVHVAEKQFEGNPVGKDRWFGHWTGRTYALVGVLAAQSWLAGLVVRQFSTVSKGVVSSISTVLVVMVGDAIGNKYHYSQRFLPSVLITGIVVLSAMIFQTGRINMQQVRRRLALQHANARNDRSRTLISEMTRKMRTLKKDTNLFDGCLKYSVVVCYIWADSLRSTVMFVVQANRFMVPQTMVIISAVCGVAFASLMTLRARGFDGLRRAWSPRKLQKFMLCGFLQAVTSSLSSLAYALGTSPAIVVALGKVYTPLVAVFSRCILGVFFTWLEWFALVILTAASLTFGLLDNVGQERIPGNSTVAGVFCVIASATTSCLMSLVMEKLLKSERDPFIMQKVRLDFGSIIFSAIFLPILGGLSTIPGTSRNDLAFWVYRPGPDFWTCEGLAQDLPRQSGFEGCIQETGEFIVNWTKVGNSTILAADAAQCVCGRGMFLGWCTNWTIYAGLAIVVFHSWVTGLLVTQFSSVFRAIADGIPVLLIYFCLDPLFSRIPLAPFQSAYTTAIPWPPPDWTRDAICLVLPISGTTFSSASAEMKKALRLYETTSQAQLGNEDNNHVNNSNEHDDESESTSADDT